MVLQGDFIPPLCTLSQLSRLCFNIRVRSKRSTLDCSPSVIIKIKEGQLCYKCFPNNCFIANEHV